MAPPVAMDIVVTIVIAQEIWLIITARHTVALEKWGQVMRDLVSRAADQVEIRRLLQGDGEHFSTAVMTTLERWRSEQGDAATLKALARLFRTHNLNSLADELEGEQFRNRMAQITAIPSSTHDPSPAKGIWFGMKPCIPDQYFVQRPSKMEQLDRMLLEAFDPTRSWMDRVVSVIGPEESGKTALVRKYLYQQKHFPNVIWIRAHNQSVLDSCLQELAMKCLNMSENLVKSLGTSQLLRKALESRWPGKCLFVFDDLNYDQLMDIIYPGTPELNLTPKHLCPSIVVTHREKSVTTCHQELALPEMDDEEISQFLQRRLGNQFDDTKLAALLPQVRHLPMGLLQVFQLGEIIPTLDVATIKRESKSALRVLRIAAYLFFIHADLSKFRDLLEPILESESNVKTILEAFTPMEIRNLPESARTIWPILPFAFFGFPGFLWCMKWCLVFIPCYVQICVKQHLEGDTCFPDVMNLIKGKIALHEPARNSTVGQVNELSLVYNGVEVKEFDLMVDSPTRNLFIDVLIEHIVYKQTEHFIVPKI